MSIESSAITPRLVVMLVIGVLLGTSTAFAKVADVYPELRARKDSLGTLVLASDAMVIVDVFGGVENVLLEESRQFASRSLKRFRDELAARRYAVSRSVVLSLGGIADPRVTFHTGDRPGPLTSPDGVESPGPFALPDSTAMRPPFYRHPSVSDSSLAIAWNHVLARVATLQRARGAPIDSIPEAVEVGRALEASTLGVVIIRSYEEALGKRLLKGSAMSAGPVGAEIRWALVDCRTGAVLWMDARATQNLTYESLKFRVPEMVSSLP